MLSFTVQLLSYPGRCYLGDVSFSRFMLGSGSFRYFIGLGLRMRRNQSMNYDELPCQKMFLTTLYMVMVATPEKNIRVFISHVPNDLHLLLDNAGFSHSGCLIISISSSS